MIRAKLNTWLRAGLNQNEFDKVLDAYLKPNTGLLRMSSIFVALASFVFAMLSVNAPVSAGNVYAYAITCIINLVISGLSFFKTDNSSKLDVILVNAFALSVYAFGIYNGTYASGDQTSVAFMVAIIVVPMVFNARPTVMISEILLSVTLFIIFAKKFDNPDIAVIDIADAVSFATISIVLNYMIHTSRLRALNSERKALESARELLVRIKEEEQYTAIINSLANIYGEMYLVNLKDNSLQELFTQSAGLSQYTLSSKMDAKLTVRDMISSYVKRDYVSLVSEFIDIDALENRFGDKTILNLTFLDVSSEWQRCSLIPVNREKDGTVSTILIALRKVTDEIETLESQDNLIQALAVPYDNTFAVNGCTGKSVRFQTGVAVESFFGQRDSVIDYEEGVHQYYEQHVIEEDWPLFEEVETIGKAVELLTRKKTHSFIYRKSSNGVIEYFECMMVMPDAERKDFVAAFRNVNEETRLADAQQRKLDEAYMAAKEASKAKTDFLFNISHDIRTPMNAIIGFRDLLEKHQEEPEKRQEYLDKIKGANEILLSIINNVLEMTRIEHGNVEVDETAIDLNILKDTAYSMFNSMMEQKGLDFSCSLDVRHPFIYCDVTKIRELMINLLSNSYKYTNPGGSVRLSFDQLDSPEEGKFILRTTVSDTGIGMSEEFLPHVFEEFSRENDISDTKVEGTGLGMPIVKRLVSMMHGTIGITSKKGIGTTVTLDIPHRIARPEDCKAKNEVEIDPAKFRGKRILLAEDNDLNAEIAMELLTEVGFVVDRAENGKVCCGMVENADASFYDVILMDIRMPEMDGYQAAKSIRDMQDRKKAELPIIAMTANAFEEDRKAAFRCGMNGHLAKPVNISELYQQLSSTLNCA